MKIYNRVHMCAISDIINDILSCKMHFWKMQYAYEQWET